jgi:predicted RNA-binding protein YlxR (DUF448 family)
MTAQKRQSKGPRPKHVPQRTCIACRRTDPKRALVRLVRDGEGRVRIDATGKQAGRGAYLCHDPACWDQALRRRGLERALRVEALVGEDRAQLEQFAQALPAPEP